MKTTRSQIVSESTENVQLPFIIGYRARLITTTPCRIDWKKHPELKLKESERKGFVDKVTKFLKSSKCPEHLRIKENFEIDEMNAEKIRYLCNIIDMAFYGGTLLFRAREVMKVSLWFDFLPFMHSVDAMQSCAKTVFNSIKDKPELISIIFYFNSNRFGDTARCRETNGIQVRHKLEALITTMLHEFTHFFLRIACKTNLGHEVEFKEHNTWINGAAYDSIAYYDLKSCPKSFFTD